MYLEIKALFSFIHTRSISVLLSYGRGTTDQNFVLQQAMEKLYEYDIDCNFTQV